MEYLSSLWSAVWGSGSVPEPVAASPVVPEAVIPEPVTASLVPEPEVKVPETGAVAGSVQRPAVRKRTRKQRLREQWREDEEDQDQLEAGKTIALLDEFYWRGRNGGLSSTIPTMEYDVDDKPLERQHRHRDRIHARDFRQKYTVKKRFELSEHRQRYHRLPQPIVPDHVHIADEFRRHHNLFLAPPIQIKKDRYVPRAAEKELIAQNFL